MKVRLKEGALEEKKGGDRGKGREVKKELIQEKGLSGIGLGHRRGKEIPRIPTRFYQMEKNLRELKQ